MKQKRRDRGVTLDEGIISIRGIFKEAKKRIMKEKKILRKALIKWRKENKQ